MIEFAGVTLALRTPELDDWLRHNRLSALDLFGRPPTEATLRTVAKGHADPRVPFPRPNYSPDPEPQINVLHWPTGASRFGWFVGIASESAWRKVRDQFTRRDIGTKPLIVGDSDFAFDLSPEIDGWHTDGKGHFAIKTQMQMINPRPLDLAVNGETIWLIPMVDVRYFWQHSTRLPPRLPTAWLPDRVATEAGIKATWDGWRTVFQYAIDPQLEEKDRTHHIAMVPAIVDSAGDDEEHREKWFFPDRTELDRPLEPVGPLMDAWAHSMGRRVVRHFTGLIEVQDVAAASGRHQDNIADRIVVVGTPHLLPYRNEDIASLTFRSDLTQAPWHKQQTFPEFVDVTFRQLVEFADYDLPDDITPDNQTDSPPDGFEWSQVFYGTGNRTIRVDLVDDPADGLGVETYISGTVRVVRCASWVGRVFWSTERDEDTNELIEPPGAIDVEFCGDRYFRLARTISSDYVAWTQQRHEYVMAKFRRWTPSGFDDFIDIDHDAGLVHVRSHRGDFGIDSFLVQVHQQTEFAPDQVVGVITSEWTLYPKELEQPRDSDVEGDLDCLLLTAEESIGTARELPVTIDDLTTDRFDATWQWAEAEVRPFIPADPHAVRGSLDYGRTMVWAHETAIVGVTRSQKIIEALRDRLDCVTVVAADAPDDCPTLIGDDRPDCFDWDRTDVLTSASGVAYLRRYGNEWQFIEIDCD